MLTFPQPQYLGFDGANDPLQAASKKKQQARIDALKAICRAMIRDELLSQLRESFAAALGSPPAANWQIELDPNEDDGQTEHFRKRPV